MGTMERRSRGEGRAMEIEASWLKCGMSRHFVSHLRLSAKLLQIIRFVTPDDLQKGFSGSWNAY